MPKRIYVGNLPSSASIEDVRKLFEKFGPVESVQLEPGKDFGYVEMTSGADAAIKALHQTQMGGRSLNVG